MTLFSKDGIIGAAFSLSVTTIGAGILAIPSTMQDGGVVFVLLILSLVAAMTIVSIDYLIICVDILHLRSYEDIARELLGKTFEEIVRWVLVIYNIGIAAGYIVVIGELFAPMLPVIQHYVPSFSSTEDVMIFAWAFIILPLSCIQHITNLHIVSFLAITATMAISAVIVLRYFFPLHPRQRDVPVNYFSITPRALLTLPVMMFSFDCQALVFQIYLNLGQPTRRNMLNVSCISVLVTGLSYALVGIFGYLSHAPNVEGNILNHYNPLKDRFAALGEGLYSITIIIAYVLVLFPCRDAIFILLCGYNSATREAFHDTIPAKQNVAVTFAISLLSIIIALRVSGVLFIIAILGGVCSSTLCFCYPAGFRLALHRRGIRPLSSAGLLGAIGMLIFGAVGGVVGTAMTLKTL